jgi:regulator of protease activity HflC (stomatin/prohibitin superfamily)
VLLRLGKLHAICGPGVFVIIPFVDTIASWIDQRIHTTEINAEQALTKDTVPVNIDAIVFWQVHDPERGGAGDRRLPAGHHTRVADLAPGNGRLLAALDAAVGSQAG